MEYIEVLYDKEDNPLKQNLSLEQQQNVAKDSKVSKLLKIEIFTAIKDPKNNKMVDIDGIYAEFLKNLAEKGRKELTKLCQNTVCMSKAVG